MSRTPHHRAPGPAVQLSGAALVALLVLLAACSPDDGASVTVIGSEDGGSVSGSASASGPASGSASTTGAGSASTVDAGGPNEDGGYAYASDVAAHRLVTLDVCAITDLLDEGAEAGTIDFAAIDEVYTEGLNSVNGDGSVRSLAGFATATDRLHGLDEHFDAATPLDDFVSAAIAGTGPFQGESDAVRAQGVEKGIQNQVMVAWTVHELNTALTKAADGDLDPASGAPHNWDEAWAFYHGAAPGCAPFATARSRAENFGTLTDDGEASANAAILAAMRDGRDALLAGDVDAATAAAEAIVRNLVITYSQAAIRYATLAAQDIEAGEEDTAREHQVEGWAFFRVIEPIAADAGADTGAVLAILEPSAEPGQGGGDAVSEALAPAWEALGVTADEVGALQ